MANEAMTIGNITVKPGEMKRGKIEIGKDLYGNTRGLPVIVYNGIKDGPCLWLTGCTHGDEPEGPFSMFLLMKRPEMDVTKIAGSVVLVPEPNVEAATSGQRGDPRDNMTYDMNRIYPGKPDGFRTERVAWIYDQYVKKYADLHLALHSGGDHSMLCRAHFCCENPESLELSRAMGPDWDLANSSGEPGRLGSPTSWLAGMGKGALTVEHGGWCKTLQNDFRDVAEVYVKAYINVMKYYHMIEGEAEIAPVAYRSHQIACLAGGTGIFVGEDVPLRTMLKKGTTLGRIYNLYGDQVDEIKAPADGQIFGLRSRPAVMEGEWCCFFAVIDEVRDDIRVSKK